MCSRTSFIALLVIFLQILSVTNAFQCYQCFGPPCNENTTTKVTCTEDSIKEGMKHLAKYYSFNSSSLNPPYQVQCLKLETIFGKIAGKCWSCNWQSIIFSASKEIVLGETVTSSVFFKGCAVKQIDTCELPITVFFRSEIDKSCNLCSGNLCNGGSSVTSSVFAVVGLTLFYMLIGNKAS